MKTFYAVAGLAAGASAAMIPRGQAGCCFQMTASGGESGTVGQLSDGQNRIGGGYSPATYCINNGGITDENGRGCILTPSIDQFQCDSDASPTYGFSIGSGGSIEYDGSIQFYACPASDTEYNIYTTPVADQKKCVEITLSTGGTCSGSSGSGGSGSSPSASASAPASYAPPSSSVPMPASSHPAASSSWAPASSYSPMPSSVHTPSAPASAYSSPAPASPYSSAPASVYSSSAPPTAHSSSPASVYSSSSPAIVYSSSTPASVYSSVPASVYSSSSPATVYSSSAPATGCSSAPASVSSSSSSSQPASLYSSSVLASVYTSAPASSSASTPASYAPTAPVSASACQTALSGAYQTPILIVPVSSSSPDTAYGTSYYGQINSTTSTVFNFDIPESYAGKQCSIIFLFPEQSQLETSSYEFSGSGSIDFCELSGVASLQTSESNLPSCKTDLGSISVQPGNSYVVSTGACAAGQMESIEASSSGGLALEFFEDWNPSPIGLFITSC